jgi:hypothetical protein
MPRWNDVKPWPGYTLQSLAEVGHDISTWCRECQTHGVVFRPDDLIPKLGPDFRVRRLVEILVCAYCGERSAQISIAVRQEMTISRLVRD